MTHSTEEAKSQRSPRALALVDRLSLIGAYGAAIALTLLMLNVAVDVVMRTFFHRPLLLTLELSTYWWMPALVVLSFAFTEHMQEHIKVTMLLDRLPTRMRQYVEGSFSALATVLLLLLAWFTMVDATNATELQQAVNSSPPLPIWPAKILVAVGIILLALQTAATTFRHFTGLSRFEDVLTTEADAV